MSQKITNSTNRNTNLFYQLYSRPNDLTDSGFTCQSAVDEADTSFDVDKSEGKITDSNGDTLASIDLSGIHSDELTEYYTETKIIQPYSAYLVQGNVQGDAYAAQYFLVPKEYSEKESWESFVDVRFDVHYSACGKLGAVAVDSRESRREPGSVCELLQARLDELAIPVTVSVREMPLCGWREPGCPDETGEFLCFQSSDEGYAFWVHTVVADPVTDEYENSDGSWADYSESPFSDAGVDFDYAVDLIKRLRPRVVDPERPADYSSVPCDLYEFVVSIGPMAFSDRDAFMRNYRALKGFASCVGDDGKVLSGKESDFAFYGATYGDVYSYYYGNRYGILNRYDVRDVLALLDELVARADAGNATGPRELREDRFRRVGPRKYPNGALRGLVLVPDWSDASTDGKEVLQVASVADEVVLDEPVEVPSDVRLAEAGPELPALYARIRTGVRINALLESEYEIYKSCGYCRPLLRVASNGSLASCDPGALWTKSPEKESPNKTVWTESPAPADSDSVWSDSESGDSKKFRTHQEHHEGNHPELLTGEYVNEYEVRVPKRYEFLRFVPGKRGREYEHAGGERAIGLYRYMAYLSENDLWTRVGDGYMSIGAKDDYQSKAKNLQNSFLVYNPNPFPVRVKMMVFS